MSIAAFAGTLAQDGAMGAPGVCCRRLSHAGTDAPEPVEHRDKYQRHRQAAHSRCRKNIRQQGRDSLGPASSEAVWARSQVGVADLRW